MCVCVCVYVCVCVCVCVCGVGVGGGGWRGVYFRENKTWNLLGTQFTWKANFVFSEKKKKKSLLLQL